MEIRDFLFLSYDVDVYDDATEELGIAFCGPIALTEEGKKHFAIALSLPIHIDESGEFATVHVDHTGSPRPWQENLQAAKELFEAAAGYCSETDYNTWFTKDPGGIIDAADLDILEENGWNLVSINEQNGQLCMNIKADGTDPVGDPVTATIVFQQEDTMATAARRWVVEHPDTHIMDKLAENSEKDEQFWREEEELKQKEVAAARVNPEWERRCLRLSSEDFQEVVTAVYVASGRFKSATLRITTDGPWIETEPASMGLMDDDLISDLSQYFDRDFTDMEIDSLDNIILFYI